MINAYECFLQLMLTSHIAQINEDDQCFEFRMVKYIKYRTHLFYLDYEYESEEESDVTLVAQLSMDRLQMIEPLVKHWEGMRWIYLCFWLINRVSSSEVSS